MRTTVTLDDDLVQRAMELTGETDRSRLIKNGLTLLIEREAARRLAALSGSDPEATAGRRHRTA